MIYTYNDILNIKKDIEWAIHEMRTKPKLRVHLELQSFSNALEGELWAYEDLLVKVGRNGEIDSVKDNCGFLDVTSELIKKTKINISGIQ